MRVVCAWCEAEGVLTVLGNVPDSSGMSGDSHGVCPRHLKMLKREAAALFAREHKQVKTVDSNLLDLVIS